VISVQDNRLSLGQRVLEQPLEQTRAPPRRAESRLGRLHTDMAAILQSNLLLNRVHVDPPELNHALVAHRLLADQLAGSTEYASRSVPVIVFCSRVVRRRT
jgi:hypothetical protein